MHDPIHHQPLHRGRLSLLICAILLFGALGNSAVADGDEAPAEAAEVDRAADAERRHAERERRNAERRSEEHARAVAEAQRRIEEAAGAMEKAREQLVESRHEDRENYDTLREELSRAHRSLRDASREVARAHRDLAMADRRLVERVRMINVGDRAVLGVLLGPARDEGIPLVGVSPDGPAERAGVRAGDILVAIRGESLAGRADDDTREVLFEVMDGIDEGEDVPLEVLREGERMTFTVRAERREPASWQSLLALSPDAPLPPGAPVPPGAPFVVTDRIEIDIPEIDFEQLEEDIERIQEQVQHFEYRFTGEDGETVEFSREFEFDHEALSEMGRRALAEANMVFGLPHTRGLELVAVDESLGRYFKTDRGVLVVRAEDDNAYGLESGDVILAVADTDVNRPSDVLRALRDADPGSEVVLTIKRERRDRTLTATVPERRLGALHFGHPAVAPRPVPHPEAPTAPVAPRPHEALTPE